VQNMVRVTVRVEVEFGYGVGYGLGEEVVILVSTMVGGWLVKKMGESQSQGLRKKV